MRQLIKSIFRKKRASESWIKYTSYLLHMWLGLLSSLTIFVLCITGSIYAFKTQIVELYNYDTVFIKPTGTSHDPDELVASLKTQQKALLSITIPEDRGHSWLVSYKDRSGAVKGTYYDPYRKKELGGGDHSLNIFFETILDLHRNLLMGSVGRQIGGASVLVLISLLISGFVLWLPKKLKYLKQRMGVKFGAKFQRINYDLHNVLGFYTMLFLAFIAITGVYITYPWVKNGLIVALGGEPISKIKISDSKADDAFAGLMNDMLQRQDEKSDFAEVQQVSLSKIITETQTLLPKPGTVTVEFPNEENPRFGVKKINTQNLLGALVPDELTFDKKGRLKTQEIFMEKPLDKQFTSLSKPLHTGEIMGLPSIIFYFIISLIGASMPVTGFIIWYHRFVKIKKNK